MTQAFEGKVKISNKAIEEMVKLATLDVDGVFCLGQGSKLIPAIKISVVQGVLSVRVAITVKADVKVKNVCEQVQKNVKQTIQDSADILVSSVHVTAVGMKRT